MTKSVRLLGSISLAALLVLQGCSRPSAANTELRKQNQSLRDEIAALKVKNDGLASSLRATQGGTSTTAPSLSPGQLDSFYTAHSLTIGRLTGGSDFDPARPGEDGLKVYVVPTDQQGDSLKASGTFTVEAFDLSRPSELRVGHWDFDAAQARASWFGKGLLYTYALQCPWQTVPAAQSELTIKVVFTDALTGRQLTAQKIVKLNGIKDASAPVDPKSKP